LQAAEIAGLRALAVHAKDDEATVFYERHLLALLKDVKKDLGIV
jgi:hypothetical protein